MLKVWILMRYWEEYQLLLLITRRKRVPVARRVRFKVDHETDDNNILMKWNE